VTYTIVHSYDATFPSRPAQSFFIFGCECALALPPPTIALLPFHDRPTTDTPTTTRNPLPFQSAPSSPLSAPRTHSRLHTRNRSLAHTSTHPLARSPSSSLIYRTHRHRIHRHRILSHPRRDVKPACLLNTLGQHDKLTRILPTNAL
jgi:hypothetical protein